MKYSLTRFPEAFLPLTVIVGDRREPRPKTSGDLLAYSASTVDILFLSRLQLPPETLILSDKVFLLERPEVLRQIFKGSNILTIGSPVVNLFSRSINDQSLFKFDIDPTAKRQMKDQHEIVERYKLDQYALSVYKSIVEHGANSIDDVLRISFRDQRVADDERIHRLFDKIYDQVSNSGLESYREPLRKHEGRALLDPVQDNRINIEQPKRRCEVIRENIDFGIVFIAKHPFSKSNENVVVYVAGRHGPGTANGVRMLAERKIWKGRDFGGIFEVQLNVFEPFSRKLQVTNRVWETTVYQTKDFRINSLQNQAESQASCFISHSSEDFEFARQLYEDLKERGVQCWFAPESIRAGRKIRSQIKEAIRSHDKLLLILSVHSMRSGWVESEIRSARAHEMKNEKQTFFPISLVPYEEIKDWELFDSDAVQDLAAELREYYIPDFSDWQNVDSYRDALTRLVRDLQS